MQRKLCDCKDICILCFPFGLNLVINSFIKCILYAYHWARRYRGYRDELNMFLGFKSFSYNDQNIQLIENGQISFNLLKIFIAHL